VGDTLVESKFLINEILVDLFNHILRLEERNLRDQGIELSMNEVHVLEAVKKAETNTMSSIAAKLNVTIGTLTTSMNRLVKKGYVVRTSSPTDRRKVLIELTDEALKVMEVHDGFHDLMVNRLLDEYNIDDEKVLLQSLQNLKDFFYSL
jgi:DNA-binding MarR family transcriptional regulator